MINFKRQKKSPKILVIEGFWGIGKSTIITTIRQFYPVLFIPEPNYITAGVKSKISPWYRCQHNKRMILAKKYNQCGENVILERSILSSVAFYYAQYGVVPRWFNSIKSRLRLSHNLFFFFLYKSNKYSSDDIGKIKDKNVRLAISKNKLFYNNYFTFFTEIAPKLIGPQIICIKISQNPYQSINKYVRKILTDNHLNIKRKLREVKEYCANAVIFYKDKFLLLYSKKHRDFCFPQGHKNEGEKDTDTILREIKEETGFYDLEIIELITTYNIRFYRNKKIINKTIACFLIRVRSLIKTKKTLESHESYTNHFFTYEDAIKKLNWTENKNIIKCAKKIIDQIKSPASLAKKQD